MFDTLGMYKILDYVGAGGIGDVYRGRDSRLGRTVAIKVVKPEIAGNAAQRDRFIHDARAATLLSHPSIAALYEIGEDQNELFLAFEFVPGDTLRAEMGGRPMNPRRALEVATQLADALADAHSAGIIHRDLTPDNIFVTPKGRAKILDFGFSDWTSGGAERTRAAAQATSARGLPAGTVAYLSPEQALGDRGDERTDIFSLGTILFEMLTGRLPFDVTGAVPLQIVQAQAPPPSSINPAVPRELDAILQKALAKSLDQRYESAATLAAELRSMTAILDERAAAAERHGAAPAVGGTTRRSRWWIAFWLLVVAAAVIAFLYFRR